MKKLEGIEIIGSDGIPAPPAVQNELNILLSAFDLCVNGHGLPHEAMEIANLLAAILKGHTLRCKPGCALPDWAGELVKFYLENGLLAMAAKAAALREKPLNAKELDIYRRALIEKKKYLAHCSELADILSQAGLIMPAAAAAKLAGRDLTESNLEAVRQQILMGNPNVSLE
ncbi:MAG TPA: hypothetical protein P5080_05835 [Candidatus Paceibacterota bacterium]|nr:hypothetical protein [Candidatus Pacearchaeota archaeon]HRZ51470.1 hypothetical protein [Candidatus Paceibacterota bacterium]HSA37188.1 hypothetical protein [Candidatus Paceibacterota bacterium]